MNPLIKPKLLVALGLIFLAIVLYCLSIIEFKLSHTTRSIAIPKIGTTESQIIRDLGPPDNSYDNFIEYNIETELYTVGLHNYIFENHIQSFHRILQFKIENGIMAGHSIYVEFEGE